MNALTDPMAAPRVLADDEAEALDNVLFPVDGVERVSSRESGLHMERSFALLVPALILYAGLKPGNLIRLRLPDVDDRLGDAGRESRMTLELRRCSGDRDPTYETVVPANVAVLLCAWLEARSHVRVRGDYVFPNPAGGPLEVGVIARFVMDALLLAGVQIGDFQQAAETLRTTFAVNALRGGMPSDKLANALGISSALVVRRYKAVADDLGPTDLLYIDESEPAARRIPALPLSDKEIVAFVKALPELAPIRMLRDREPDGWRDHRDHAILAVLLYSGIRADELMDLRLSQVDDPFVGRADQGAIILKFSSDKAPDHTGTVPGTTHEPIVLSYGAMAFRAWLETRTRLGIPGDQVFPSNIDGSPLKRLTFYRVVSRAFKRAGLDMYRAGAHTLRVTYANEEFRSGVKLDELQRRLGISLKGVYELAKQFVKTPSPTPADLTTMFIVGPGSDRPAAPMAPWSFESADRNWPQRPAAANCQAHEPLVLEMESPQQEAPHSDAGNAELAQRLDRVEHKQDRIEQKLDDILSMLTALRDAGVPRALKPLEPAQPSVPRVSVAEVKWMTKDHSESLGRLNSTRNRVKQRLRSLCRDLDVVERRLKTEASSVGDDPVRPTRAADATK